MLENGEIPFEDQPEIFNILGKMCRQLKTIPDSMRIENCSTDPMDEEHDGGYATVSRGIYRGRPVAIKTLRLYLTSNFEDHFGVSVKFSRMLREIHSHDMVSRNFAGKLLPGGTYDTRTSYLLLVLIWNGTDSRWYPSGWIVATSAIS